MPRTLVFPLPFISPSPPAELSELITACLCSAIPLTSRHVVRTLYTPSEYFHARTEDCVISTFKSSTTTIHDSTTRPIPVPNPLALRSWDPTLVHFLLTASANQAEAGGDYLNTTQRLDNIGSVVVEVPARQQQDSNTSLTVRNCV